MDIGDEAGPDYELEESDCTEEDHYPPEDEVGFPYIFSSFSESVYVVIVLVEG